MNKKKVQIYCGDWTLIPESIRTLLQVKAWTIETQDEMKEYGFQLAKMGGDIFTNNEVVLNAIRVAVKRNPDKVSALMRFYGDVYPLGYVVEIDRDGNLSANPKHFFEANINMLMELF